MFSFRKIPQIVTSVKRDQNQPLEPLIHPSNLFLTLDHPLTLNGKPQTLMHWFLLHIGSCVEFGPPTLLFCFCPCLLLCLFYWLLYCCLCCLFILFRLNGEYHLTLKRDCEQRQHSKASDAHCINFLSILICIVAYFF